MSHNEHRRWLSVATIAKELNTNRSRVIEWIRAGMLPAISTSCGAKQRLPRFKIMESDYLAFIASEKSKVLEVPDPPKPARARSSGAEVTQYF
jgi:excisionase family DNA binding protein